MVPAPRFVAITDTRRASEGQHLEAYRRIAAWVPAGQWAVQLREPHRDARAMEHFARQLQDELGPFGVPLIVNDRLDIALAVKTSFVHLGTRSVSVTDARRLLGNAAYVSVACHSVEDVQRAAQAGANAVLLSPIFSTPGKGLPHGPAVLTAAVRCCPPVAVIALGGVDASNAAACRAAGAWGVAAIRAWWGQDAAELVTAFR